MKLVKSDRKKLWITNLLYETWPNKYDNYKEYILSKVYYTYCQFRLLLENKGKKGTGSYVTSATGNNTQKTDKNEPSFSLTQSSYLIF